MEPLDTTGRTLRFRGTPVEKRWYADLVVSRIALHIVISWRLLLSVCVLVGLRQRRDSRTAREQKTDSSPKIVSPRRQSTDTGMCLCL